MNLTEYQELMKLLGDIRDKVAFLSRLFPSGLPTTRDVELGPAQKKALKDIDEAWSNFRERAKILGAWMDEPKQGQLKV